MEQGQTRNQVLSQLVKSPHGNLSEYVPVGQIAAREDPEFYARLIAWNQIKGSIRDSKVALPVISLSTAEFPAALIENSLAHLALLAPKQMLQAWQFARDIKTPGHTRALKRMIPRYLERVSKSERRLLQHRRFVRQLCALAHAKPTKRIDAWIFGTYKGMEKSITIADSDSMFEVVKKLKGMSPGEAAGTIMQRKIPYLIAKGALSKTNKEIADNPELALALIKSMTPTEVEANTKGQLVKWGIKTNPALRAAFEEALGKVSKSTKSTFKATKAAEAQDKEDEDIQTKIRAVQERKIQALQHAQGGIEGNWAVLGDKSGSMEQAMAVSTEVAATLARLVKGKVVLVFFDTSPTVFDATGKSYEELKARTQHFRANGGTSIGCGLLAAVQRLEGIDGIAVVSDGQENNPPHFVDVYKSLNQATGKMIPVYFYRCKYAQQGWGDRDLARAMKEAGQDIQEFDLTGGTDYYALPNIVGTMRVNRYSLIDEIMETPLLTLSEVFDGKEAP